MAKWELLTKHKDNGGYYIGWRKLHPMIHMPEPMQPMGKSSLVQIGGSKGCYQVRGMTTAHSIFPNTEYSIGKQGIRLFDEAHICKTLPEAQTKATELKRRIAKMFDGVTKSDNEGQLILRPNLAY